MFGNIITSVGTSIIGGLPSKLAAQWFKPTEYDIANSLACTAAPFGTIITFIAAPFIAKEPDDLLYLQVFFAIPIFLAFIGSLFIKRDGYNSKVTNQSFKVMVAELIDFSNLYVFNNYVRFSTFTKEKNIDYFPIGEHKIIFTDTWSLHLRWFCGSFYLT